MSAVLPVSPGAGVGRVDQRQLAWFLRGVVAATAAGAVVRVRGHEYPMPPGARYAPGAELRLKLVFARTGWQLQILGPAGGEPQAPAAKTAGFAGLAELITRLGSAISPEQALRLLPAALPARADAVAAVLQRLAAAAGAGPALGQLVQLLSGAVTAGAVPAGHAAAQAALGWLVYPGADPERFRASLRRSLGAPEGLLARLLLDPHAAPPASLARTPEQLLVDLAADEALTAHFRGAGQLDAWQGALHELLDRVDGDRLLELHGASNPYRFVELPMAETSGWRRAQVHLLAGPGPAVAVLDVNTEHLGDVWMRLSATPAGGFLKVQARAPTTVREMRRDAARWADRLAAVGYPAVRVEVEPWDGDRLRAAVALFDPRRVEVDL